MAKKKLQQGQRTNEELRTALPLGVKLLRRLEGHNRPVRSDEEHRPTSIEGYLPTLPE
jgi:hypothetical protein